MSNYRKRHGSILQIPKETIRNDFMSLRIVEASEKGKTVAI